MQKQIKKEQESAPLVMDKSELEAIQKTPAKRIVILNSKSCCGCGCSDIKVKRVVTYDSPLNDGDYVRESQLKGDDEIIW